jgi:beta-glucanase (GH16 family)
MENIGKEPGKIHGTLHGPGYSGVHGIGKPESLPDGESFADAFHVFAVECDTNRIAWFLDGREYFALTSANLPKNARWVFNSPKFFLLNLAVGGQWPGYPDDTTTFPQRRVLDYVRVYEKAAAADIIYSASGK